MDQLERARRRHHGLGRASHRLGAGDDQDGAQALAPGQHAVAHGAMNARGLGLVGEQRGAERVVHALAPIGEIGLKVETAHGSSSVKAKGFWLSAPASSLARTSMRRSASARYFEQ